jgi:hypothetical protein
MISPSPTYVIWSDSSYGYILKNTTNYHNAIQNKCSINMKKSLEFCALRYLLLWTQKEKNINLQTNSIEADEIEIELRKGLNYFRISRNFKNLDGKDKARIILDSIEKAGSKKSSTPEKNVVYLAHKFKDDFGQFNLSAASKLLWLKYQHPYIIYDSRAVVGLKTINSEFLDKDYTEFSRVWHTEYNKIKKDIVTAANKLPSLHMYFSDFYGTPKSIKELVSKEWFLERIFDIYLWELGEKKLVQKNA